MRLILLDVIRSISIILLLIAHIAQYLESPLGGFFGIPGFYHPSLGGVAVTFFLILSGLVLELKYSTKKIKFINFVFKRCLRIYPIYWLALLVGFILYISQQISQNVGIFKILASFKLNSFILTITGFNAFIGNWGGKLLPTSWFIGVILTLYFLYPIVAQFIRNNPHRTIIFLFGVSVFFRLILGKFYYILPTRPLDWFPLCRIFEFSLGIYLANTIPANTWKTLNSTKFNYSFLKFISEISFPLFLVHYPLLTVISAVSIYFNIYFAITIYLCVSIIVSWILLIIDRKIPRTFILNFLAIA